MGAEYRLSNQHIPCKLLALATVRVAAVHCLYPSVSRPQQVCSAEDLGGADTGHCPCRGGGDLWGTGGHTVAACHAAGAHGFTYGSSLLGSRREA